MEQQVLELAAANCQAAEVYGVDSSRTVVEFRAGALHSQETRLVRGVGVRVFRDGRVGFSSSTNPEALEDLVQAALDTAELGREARFSLPGPEPGPAVAALDNRVMLLPPARLAEMGMDLIAAVRSRVPDLKLDVQVNRTFRQVRILNTAGVDADYDKAVFDLSVTGLLVLADGLFWAGDWLNLSDGRPPQLEPVADHLTELARAARHKAEVTSGTWPVIVMPTALPNLLVPLEAGVNGKQREKGTTPLLGREGRQVLDAKLTITDNPLRPYAVGSAPYDGEGVPRRRNVLFDKGVFRGFLYDRATAAACGARSTGSAGRDYSSIPQPATSNIEVAAGTAALAPTIAGMKEGLVVYDFIGGGQSNLLAGEVALNVSCGFKVEAGRIVGRVKDALVAGNVYEMLTGVEAVGNTVREYGSYAAPFVKFAGLKVAAK